LEHSQGDWIGVTEVIHVLYDYVVAYYWSVQSGLI
jgi:hypothetical protein